MQASDRRWKEVTALLDIGDAVPGASSKKKLSKLGLFSLEEDQGSVIRVYKDLKKGYKDNRVRLFSDTSSDRTRGNRT